MNSHKNSLLIFVSFFFFNSVVASLNNDQVIEIKIQIPPIEIQPQVLLDTIPIFLESSLPIGGFDLKIKANSQAMFSIIDIIPGEFTDSCKWELFSAKSNEIIDSENNRIKIWKIVSLPEVIPDDISPLCRQLNHRAVLCKLIIKLQEQNSDETDLGNISFYWEACRDNVISSESGRKLYLSESVADSTGRNGAPEDCISKRTEDKLVRAVTFINGNLTRAVIDSTFFAPESLSN